MTDLEMTRLCAEAMGLSITYADSLPLVVNDGTHQYHPLVVDAQAMALLKKIRLEIACDYRPWVVWKGGLRKTTESVNADLNRAIVECVAKMGICGVKDRSPEIPSFIQPGAL